MNEDAGGDRVEGNVGAGKHWGCLSIFSAKPRLWGELGTGDTDSAGTPRVLSQLSPELSHPHVPTISFLRDTGGSSLPVPRAALADEIQQWGNAAPLGWLRKVGSRKPS